MTKSLEAIAELYRQYGWEKQARELEAEAQRFKAVGMPEQFEHDVRGEEEQVPLEALKREWVEILAAEPDRPSLKWFSPMLVARINRVGQKFDDGTYVGELAVKEVGKYSDFHIPGQPSTGEAQTYKIQHNSLVETLDQAINDLLLYGFDTVGKVRNAPPTHKLYKELWMRNMHKSDTDRFASIHSALEGIQFMKTALTKPSQARPLATRK